MTARDEIGQPEPLPPVGADGAASEVVPPRRSIALLEPLRGKLFRTIWIASLLSNFGQLIQGVGAAWEMTRLSASADKVALVQTAIMLPLMLVALPAGAIADMFDRRKVALLGLGFACLSAALLTLAAYAGIVGPKLLLAFCFLIGTGVAIYGPAWQSSVSEQVPARHLPSAIALGSISYNIARSFGPAIGGVLVATAGAVAAFGANALLYLPLMLALIRWKRVPTPSRLPPERIDRAIISGVRYVVHSPPIRIVLTRTLLTGLAGASVSALAPLVAKDLLQGSAGTYGLLLGAYGVGAVAGALFIDQARNRFSADGGVRTFALVAGLMIIVVGFSRSTLLTCAAMAVCGAVWMLLVAMFNVGVQLSAPRWVTARALACFSCAITGGIAFGAWGWGHVAGQFGTGTAMMVSGIAIMLTALVGAVLPMPRIDSPAQQPEAAVREPEVALALTSRSGPVIIEVDYRIAIADARDFYGAMQAVRGARLRSGGFAWSLARDIADPELWTERYHCPTWGDYLRQRERLTRTDEAAQTLAGNFHRGGSEGRVRRRLERPFGSVRWRNDTPDPHSGVVGPYAP